MNGKKAAGHKAIDEVKEGMTIGLGTGSTVYYFLEALAEKVAEGLSVTCVATSNKTANLAIHWKIPVYPMGSVKRIDLTIDGADEVDPYMNGIKGGGGALLYEKIIAQNSDKRIWIIDNKKLKKYLGEFPLPIEVVPFGWEHLEALLGNKGYNPELRLGDDGQPFVTDAQHYILDLHLEKIDDPYSISDELDHMTGIVEHGLFLNVPNKIIIGYSDGHVEHIESISRSTS